jgi:hypothetical protein
MPSSTSSSEQSESTSLPQALARVARTIAPTVLVAVLFGTATFAISRRRAAPPEDIESIVIQRQFERSKSLPQVDVLLIGDSSALMDVDVTALEERLGQRVESLATVGFVGPAGYAHLLERYATGGRHLPTVVLLMHGYSLSLAESVFQTMGFERMVLTDQPRLRERRFKAAQRTLADALVRPVVSIPLPGLFAKAYGWREDLVAAIDAGHGSLTDPNTLSKRGTGYEFSVSDAVANRLGQLGQTLATLHPDRLLFAITPLPEDDVGPSTLSSRAQAAARVASLLGTQATMLDGLPPMMSRQSFASPTHLAASGRESFTTVLGDTLITIK